MRANRAGWWCAAILLGGMAAGATGGESSRPVDINRVPPLVLRAAREDVPGARFTGATHDLTAGGVESYTLRGRAARGGAVEVVVWPNGTVVTIRGETPLNGVPRAVLEAVATSDDALLKGFRPTKAELVVMTQLDARDYVLTGANGQGQAVEARVKGDTKAVFASLSNVTAAALAGAAPNAKPADAPAPAPGKLLAKQVLTSADDFVVEVYHNGKAVPLERRKMTAENYGATAEAIDVEVRQGDWLVFHVVCNRLRWDGARYFAAAGRGEDGASVTFTSELTSGRWSACDDPGDVPKFLAERDFKADARALAIRNPWGGGDPAMQQMLGDTPWKGTPVWGAQPSTWIKFVAR
jgi:hypothetical protein